MPHVHLQRSGRACFFSPLSLSLSFPHPLPLQGSCRAPDCQACCSSSASCDTCGSGVGGHRCVSTPVQLQCVAAQDVSSGQSFQYVAKLSFLAYDSTAYSWIQYAGSREVASAAFVAQDGRDVFAGQQAQFASPFFNSTSEGSQPLMFYNTGVFGPLDYQLVRGRIQGPVSLQLCNTDGTCTRRPCVGFDAEPRPVLTPSK